MSVAWLLFATASWAATVTSTGDTNTPGTLRHAILNAQPNDTIDFAVTEVVLTSPLPNLTVDGLTITGGGLVAIKGAGLASAAHGLVVQADGVSLLGLKIRDMPGSAIVVRDASGTTIGGPGSDENALFGNAGAGVRVEGGAGGPASATVIDSNRIGLRFNDSSAGNCVSPIGECAGVLVLSQGGDVIVRDNVISANLGDGVRMHASGALITGNAIGLSASGVIDKGNAGDGILVSGASASDQADNAQITYNVVAGNDGHGITLAAYSRWAVVSANGLGVDLAGAALGNDGDGVRITDLTTDHQVLGSPAAPSVVSANGGQGVGVSGEGHVISGLTIGTTAASPHAAMGNGSYGIRVFQGTGGHSIGQLGAGNVVADNALGGIWVDASDVDVGHNLVGFADDGVTALGNGADPLGVSGGFGGIKVTAPVVAGTSGPVVHDNLVGANHGHGVLLLGDAHSTFTHSVAVSANDIGVDDLGAAAANLGDGVRVQGVDHAILDGNLIAHNAEAGVRVTSLPSASSNAVTVSNNTVRDHGSHGIVLAVVFRGGSVTGGLVDSNTVHDNGGAGIYSDGGATANELTHNAIYDNTQCGILDVNESDTSTVVEAPYAKGVDDDSINGAIDLLGATLTRIEVYVDDGTHIVDVDGADVSPNGRFLVDETQLGVVVPDNLTAEQIVMLAVLADGTTSELTKQLGDGCTPDTCIPPGGVDDDSCQIHYLDPGLGCITVHRPEGYRCSDGNHLTGMINHRLDPDETWLYQDQCDGWGECVSGTDLTTTFGLYNEGDACPWKTNCNTAVVDPEGCTYSPVCGDTYCGADDQSSGGCGSAACSECPTFDADGDNILDAWDLGDFDYDCDGNVDAGSQVGGAAGSSSSNQIYVYIAYMSMDCSNEPGAPNAVPPYTVHTHRPHEQTLQKIIDSYFDQGIELVVEQTCIPEATIVSDDQQSWDPDCNDLGDFENLDDIKARHFPPHKRGLYHFALMAHANAGPRANVDPLDEICTGKHSAAGVGEPRGGDDSRVVNARGTPSDPLDSPNRASETRTLGHELGHNFGLSHGGANDAGNKTPNVQSIMNYRYNHSLYLVSDPGKGKQIMDFSQEVMATLDEDDLDEGAMLPTTLLEPRMLRWTCPDGTTGTSEPEPAAGYVDWNCNGYRDPGLIDVDLTGIKGLQPPLEGYDEWSNVASERVCSLAGRRDWVLSGNGIDADTRRFGPMAPAVVQVNPSCTSDAVSLDDSFPTVAVLYGSTDLDVSEVRPDSARLGGAPPSAHEVLDTNGDGRDDLRLRFRPSDMPQLEALSERMYFTAYHDDGTLFYGEDDITPGVYPDTDGDGVMDPCE
jgi:parallel beta-helix repeat protein